MAYARTRTSKSEYSGSGNLFWRETSDTPTPLFKARVASGELICNDYESGVYNVQGPVGSDAVTGFHLTKITGGVPPTIDIGYTTTATTRQETNSPTKWATGSPASRIAAIYQRCGSNSPPGPDDETWAEAHTKLSADLNTGISSILVSAAELPKTVKMINKALTYLRNPLINAKNKLRLTRAQMRTPSGRKAALDMAEQDWLEGRYGWRPFIYDVMSWVEAGKSKYSDRRTVKTAVQKLDPPPYTAIRKGSSRGLTVAGTSVWKAEFVASSGQTADFGVNLSQFARTWGALDVVGTGWELIKFSFILDWFLNLGDTLKALQVYALIDERIGWNKITSVGTITTTYTYPALGLYGKYLVDGYTNYQSIPTVERGQMTKRMRVDSFLPNLGWTFNVDCGKTLDLLAIIHQLYKGGSRRP